MTAVSDGELVGRDDLAADVVAAVRRGGAAIVGPPGSGLSSVLRLAASVLRDEGASVRIVRLPDERDDVLTLDPHDDDQVLVVDDVQHGTRLQLLALRDLALTHPVLLAARTGAAGDVVRWLWRSGAVEQFDVPPLDDAAIAEIIDERATGTVLRAARDAIVHRVGGRPGFAVDEATALAGGQSMVPLSGRLVERAHDLLSTIPETLADMVVTLAVAGQLPMSATAALTVDVPALERRALIRRIDEGGGASVALDPPVLAPAVRATLAQAISAERSRRVLAVARDDLTAEDRARVRALAGESVGLDDLEAGARRALLDGRFHDAAHLARLAARHGSEGEAVAADVLDDLGERAEAADRYAALMLDDAAPAHLRARAAMEHSLILMWDLARPEEAVATAVGFADAAASTPFADAARVHLASLTMYAGRAHDALAILADIDRSRLDDAAMAGLALIESISRALVDPANADPRSLDGYLRATSMTGTHERGVMVAGSELTAELLGHYSEATAIVSDARLASSSDETPPSLAWLALAEARAHLAVGRHHLARRAGIEAATLYTEINHRSGQRWAQGAVLMACAIGADRDATRTALDDFERLAPGIPFLDADLIRARAWAAWRLGNSESAASLFREAADTAAAVGAVTLEAVALHDAFRLLRVPVRSRLSRLARVAAVPSITLRSRHVELATSDATALAALAGEFEAAGALLVAADVAGDAVNLAASTGMRSLARSAHGMRLRLAAECGDPATPSLAEIRPAALTAREHDVVTLAAEGRTSREIAAELDVSVRTVDNLLQRAYVKLGVHSRTELADRLMNSSSSAWSRPMT